MNPLTDSHARDRSDDVLRPVHAASVHMGTTDTTSGAACFASVHGWWMSPGPSSNGARSPTSPG